MFVVQQLLFGLYLLAVQVASVHHRTPAVASVTWQREPWSQCHQSPGWALCRCLEFVFVLYTCCNIALDCLEHVYRVLSVLLSHQWKGKGQVRRVRISGPFADQARPLDHGANMKLFNEKTRLKLRLTEASVLDENARRPMGEYMNRWLVCLLLVVSCSASLRRVGDQLSLDQLASSNQAKLMRISPGMQKEEVISLMGTDTAKTHRFANR